MNIMEEQQEISDLNNELVEKAMVKLEAAVKVGEEKVVAGGGFGVAGLATDNERPCAREGLPAELQLRLQLELGGRGALLPSRKK